MNPLEAVDKLGDQGPRLRRWEAALLGSLNHGEGPFSAGVMALVSVVASVFMVGLAAAQTIDALWVSWFVAESLLSAFAFWIVATLFSKFASIEFHWWRWLAGRGRPGRRRLTR